MTFRPTHSLALSGVVIALAASACAAPTTDAQTPTEETDIVTGALNPVFTDFDWRLPVQKTCNKQVKYSNPEAYSIRRKRVLCDKTIEGFTFIGKTTLLDGSVNCNYKWTPSESFLISQNITELLDAAAKDADGNPIIHAACAAPVVKTIPKDGVMMPTCLKCAMPMGADLYVDGTYIPAAATYQARATTIDANGNEINKSILFAMGTDAQVGIVDQGAEQLGLTAGREIKEISIEPLAIP